MRWLIVGPYAPERGEGAAATVAAATEHLAAGDEVHVIAPRPSAAHEHRPLTGPRALLEVLRQVGPDMALWARIEPGVLLSRHPSRSGALVERALLSVLLRRARRSVLDVGDLALFPGGRAGALVFGPVDELIVHSVDQRDQLVASGARPGSVRLQSDPVPAPEAPESDLGGDVGLPAPPADWSALSAGEGRAAIEAAVAARALAAPVRRVRRR